MFKKRSRLLWLSSIFVGLVVCVSLAYATMQANSETTPPLTLTEMTVNKDAVCWSCHIGYAPVSSNQYSFTPIVGGNHPYPESCKTCHPVSTNIVGRAKMQYCTACHYPRGSRPDLPKYLAARHNDPDGLPAFQNIEQKKHLLPQEHTTSTVGCNACHGTTFTNEHNIVGRTDKYGSPVDCNTCHTGSGVGDRINTNGSMKILKIVGSQNEVKIYTAPENKKIKRFRLQVALDTRNVAEVYALYDNQWGYIYGKTGLLDSWFDLPYETAQIKIRLYGSRTPSVGKWGADIPEIEFAPDSAMWNRSKTAIDGDKRSCFACHVNSKQHEPQHTWTSFSPSCESSTCHSSALVEEHLRRNKTCADCHEPAIPNNNYLQAIFWGQKNCTSCHTDAHNISLAFPLPQDIPQFAGYMWSNPVDLDLWQGESWVPVDLLDGGKMVMSNNRQDVAKDQIYTWYQQQFAGWNILMNESTENSFKLRASLEKKQVYVICSNDAPNAYRLRVIYKAVP